MPSTVKTEAKDQVATVTIDRPPVNAMTRESYLEVRDAFRALNVQQDLRVAILTGAGRAFSAGIDMKVEFAGRDPDRMVAVLQAVEEAAEAIEQCEVPVIGAINGAALAGGFVLASACDILVLSEKAQLGVPEVSVGIAGGTERLRRLLPEGKARLLAYTGQSVSPQDLLRWGGVEKVVPPEQLMAEATALAKLIASRSPLAVRAIKKSQRYIQQHPDPLDVARYHWLLSRDLFKTEDAKEAVDAFFANRPPVFKGR